MLTNEERGVLETARVGRLATADADCRPHVVPVCFALVGDDLVTPIDEKPKGPVDDLRRVRDVRENSRVALVIDRWSEDWSELGWLQIRGTARFIDPGEDGHDEAVEALRAKYDQYADHALEERPAISIEPGGVVSWGRPE